eukprot:evm.model.scf_540EXC.4 EVM.evm.TU.scf_540EXC.4   scf_540EXC:37334-41787(+)
MRAPVPSRTPFTTGDLFAAAFESLKAKSQSQPGEEPLCGAQASGGDDSAPQSSASRGRRPVRKAVRVSNRLPDAHLGRRPAFGRATAIEEDGARKVDGREEARWLEEAAGLRLKSTKHIKKSGAKKSATAQKTSVLTAKVAAARQLLQSLQDRLQAQEQLANDLRCDSQNEQLSLTRDGFAQARTEVQVAALHVAIERTKLKLSHLTTIWQNKLKAKRVLFEEMFLPECPIQSDAVPIVVDGPASTSDSEGMFEAYKELDDRKFSSDDEPRVDISASLMAFSQQRRFEEPGTGDPLKRNSRDTELLGRPQEVPECEESATDSEDFEGLDVLSSWAKAAGVHTFSLTTAVKAAEQAPQSKPNGLQQPLHKVASAVRAHGLSGQNSTPTHPTPVTVANNQAEKDTHMDNKSLPSRQSCKVESSEDDSVDVGFCDVLATWAADADAFKVCKLGGMHGKGGSEGPVEEQTAGLSGGDQRDQEGKNKPSGALMHTKQEHGSPSSEDGSDSDDEAWNFNDVLSSWASSATCPNLASVRPSSSNIFNVADAEQPNLRVAGKGLQSEQIPPDCGTASSMPAPLTGVRILRLGGTMDKANVAAPDIRILRRGETMDRSGASVSRPSVTKTVKNLDHGPEVRAAEPVSTGAYMDDRKVPNPRRAVRHTPLHDRKGAGPSVDAPTPKEGPSTCSVGNSEASKPDVKQTLCTHPGELRETVAHGVTGGGDMVENQCAEVVAAKRKRRRKGGDPPKTYLCGECGVACSSDADFLAHIQSKKHKKRVVRTATREAEAVANVSKPSPADEPSEQLADSLASVSAKSVPSEVTNTAVRQLLVRLYELQRNSLSQHLGEKHKAHRWLTNGMKEVQQAIKHRKAKAVIAACDVDAPLDVTLNELTRAAASQEIPVIYAMSRRKLGSIFHCRKKMSCIAVLDWQGAGDEFRRAKELASPAI